MESLSRPIVPTPLQIAHGLSPPRQNTPRPTPGPPRFRPAAHSGRQPARRRRGEGGRLSGSCREEIPDHRSRQGASEMCLMIDAIHALYKAKRDLAMVSSHAVEDPAMTHK
eukprot:8200333-Pyramimonas_sp.AAC.1